MDDVDYYGPAVEPQRSDEHQAEPRLELPTDPEERIAKLAAMLADCEANDLAAKAFRQCVKGLEDRHIPRKTIWAVLSQFLDAYALGVKPPNMKSEILCLAVEEHVDRDEIIKAAKQAGISLGAKPRDALRGRIAQAKEQRAERAAAVPIEVAALLFVLERRRVLQQQASLLFKTGIPPQK